MLCRLAPVGTANARYLLMCEHGGRVALFVAPDDLRAIVMTRAMGASFTCDPSFGAIAKSQRVRTAPLSIPHLEAASILALEDALVPFLREGAEADLFGLAMNAMFFASDVTWRDPALRERNLFRLRIEAPGRDAQHAALLVLGEESPVGPGITVMDDSVRVWANPQGQTVISGRTQMTVTFRRGPRWLQDLASRGWSAEVLPIPISTREEGTLNLGEEDVKVLNGVFECLAEACRRREPRAQVDELTISLAAHPDAKLLAPDSHLGQA